MRKPAISLPLAATLLCASALASHADPVFNRIATFPVTSNLPADKQENEAVSEIISASEDGMLLAYTDSPGEGLGLIDITDPKAPKPAGYIDLGGEPTSVKIIGDKAFVGIVTSKSYTEPSGHIAVVDLAEKKIVATCDLGGQPDSVGATKDGAFLAVAIENERDEEAGDGGLPQMPAGYVTILPVKDGMADCAGMKKVDVTGLAEVAPEDPEPEFVSINADGKIVLTMQENNHLVIIDAATGKVENHFSAGSVDLDGIDTKKDGKIELTGSLKGVVREPDGVAWIDNDRFVTANEGDWKGGSRSFTIFNKDGSVAYESGPSFEREIVSLGHYPDKRNKKGAELEGVDAAKFGDDTLIFVGSERASVVGIYKDTGAEPEYLQTVPSGIGPEGILAIPSRNLLVTANETDLVEDGGVRAHVMIFERAEGTPAYPTIRSANNGTDAPIAWGALSGLAADKAEAGKLYAVTDSFYSAAPRVLTIDANTSPAMITAATLVTRDGKAAENLDLEGIAMAEDGGFWLASEGRTDKDVPHALLRTDANGAIVEEISFPEALLQNEIRYGMEGVTVVGSGDDATVWVAIQREWKDDPKGMVKLLGYKPSTKAWSAAHYPLEKSEKGWVGLSEITSVGNGKVIVIERDNLIGSAAKIKKLYSVDLASVTPAEIGGELPVVQKTEVRDLIPDLKATNGFVVDKVEGFTVDAAGNGYFVTDNDGVDDSSGETIFGSIGPMTVSD
ncbi:alkaline phosphatase (Esterase-like activity of phytase) [Hartmannibacter diazotrophicus]|uniref:Alkaline phosphatase (Esterase-like activity of phytase) n=1 Tax=Hartmannibacter diazotrophicus TaxID=1482074 RepID=A0A2C9D7R0_9HYPH|nr:esterase-like activity of phytase family protein [Hartmannibacter diazotrophicus]SON56209.1 alkaline phosphatase (Esterase-like activity of phytase) [Hartmannibacter diazotrophicus]